MKQYQSILSTPGESHS